MRRLTALLVTLGTVLGAVAIVAVVMALGGPSGGVTEGSSIQSESIEVHGDWRVTIYNEDGTLDREYVFANALLPSGAEAIAVMLGFEDGPAGGPWIASFWEVAFGELSGTSPCNVDFSVPTIQPAGRNLALAEGCLLQEDTDLTVSPIDGGARLAGSLSATQDGAIDYVETWLHLVNPTSGAGEAYAFTGTDVGPFTDITAGQTIDLAVELTFATPSAP